jgi:ubiquitin C-terminal hydrolase
MKLTSVSFMNSGIQCLSNTELLMRFLVSGKYVKDINRNNPLGMKGQIAEYFARLLQDLWSGAYSSVAPVDFKHKLGSFSAFTI